MPRSKRSRLVSLTQTRKRSRESKSELINSVLTHVDLPYSNIYVFNYLGLKSERIGRIRKALRNADKAE